jgi:hypothetical protein
MLCSVELLGAYVGELRIMQEEAVIARFDIIYIYSYCYAIVFFAEVHLIYVTVRELVLLLSSSDGCVMLA